MRSLQTYVLTQIFEGLNCQVGVLQRSPLTWLKHIQQDIFKIVIISYQALKVIIQIAVTLATKILSSIPKIQITSLKSLYGVYKQAYKHHHLFIISSMPSGHQMTSFWLLFVLRISQWY